jgi:CubicO group peptidase (beta-lactamase class C family)
MKRLLGILGALLLTCGVASAAESSLHRAVAGLARDGFRGQIVIARGDHIVYERAAGNGISLASWFYVASITKSFTATAIFKLRDEGRLRLDEPITSFFHNIPADKQAITVDELLTHTSGYSDDYAADGIADRDSAVAAVLNRPMKLVTGKDFHYSNDNYALLGAIVEIVSGMSYDEFLQKEIFSPAGLTMHFWGSIPGKEKSKLAPFLHEMNPPRPMRNWGDLGSSGALTTAPDLFRWWAALIAGRILKPASVAEMMAPKLVRPGSVSIARGWFVAKTEAGRDVVFSRGQEDVGHNALLLHFSQENVTFVITSNADQSNGEGWNRIAARRLETAFFPPKGAAADR